MEAQYQFCADYFPLEDRLKVLVSIGTGKPPLEAVGEKLQDVARSIIAIATETQATAVTFHKMHIGLARNDKYFRFNPPDINDVGIDEAGKRALIAARCEAYGDDPDTEAILERWRDAGGIEKSTSTLDMIEQEMWL